MSYESEREALMARAPLVDEIDRLVALGDDISEGQMVRMVETTRAAEKLNAEIAAHDAAHAAGLTERQHKIDELKKFVNKPGHTSSGVSESFEYMQRGAAWAEPIMPWTTKNQLESRAMTALDTADYADRDRIEKLVRRDDGKADAEYVVVSSDPLYRSAFRKMIRDPQFGHLSLEPEEARAFAAAQNSEVRTAMSTSGSAGGFLIPFALDPSILLTNSGITNPFRQIARVETLSNSNVWHGVSSAGVTAEWLAEAAEATDASPTFAQPTITPIRADAYVQASYEVVEDSNIDAQLGMLFADAKDRLEGAAFATGTGVTQPTGIVTALQGVTASRVSAQTNGQFGSIDLFKMTESLPSRAQANASWAAHIFTYNLIRQMGATNMQAFLVDMGPSFPAQLLGYSAYQSSAILNAAGTTGLSSATASNDDILVLADFSQSYAIVDRIGGLLVTDPLVKGAQNRPTGQYGFFYFWRVGGGLLDGGNSARLLRV
jgi:HK97 family phage major capsid protein